MSPKQLAAVRRLEKALDHAHSVGLRGGVYECGLYVWPEDGQQPFDSPSWDFFEVVDKVGGKCFSKMTLDGGAGA